MEAFTRWLKDRITSAALSAATALIVLQFILPGIFDFMADLILLFLIWLVGFVKDSRQAPMKTPAPKDW